MCAICGIIRFDGIETDRDTLVRARDVMRNRGPEHGGLYLRGSVGLGHRRLRIIDLSECGNQPMTNEDETVWIVFNGEIYNFGALREELIALGHTFASHSDTEVIVHGYEQWGDEVIPRLDGMFALGIWDGIAGRTVLARDRFGKKPLYYLHDENGVIFASDLKAIWTVPGVQLTLDPFAVDCYLHHLGVTQDHCIFTEIRKVPPAHVVVITGDGLQSTRYWTPSFGPKLLLSEPEWLERIDASLRAAVAKRLISDVPLGAFLSGGVDSSLIVAMAAQLTDGPLSTFSVGFRDRQFSELPFARQVAERYRTDHHEIVLEADVASVLPSLVWEYGEPFADSSAIPSYYVAKAARDFATVALSGDGGDEMFGGYDVARVAWYANRFNRLVPGSVREAISDRLLRRPGSDMSPAKRKLRTIAAHASGDPAIRHEGSMAFGTAERLQLYTPAFMARLGAHTPLHVHTKWAADTAGLDLVDYYLFQTLVTRLPNDYLVKVDVASMKVALEVRSPFLDTSLSVLAGSIPSALKVRGGRQKYLLKKLAERYLPHDTIYRRKQGFALPLARWLRTDLSPLLDRFVLHGAGIRLGWFRSDRVETLMREHRAGHRDHSHRLWALLWFEIWYQLFVERSMSPDEQL